MGALRVVRPVAALGVVCVLGGCNLFGGLKFTNVSDTWLNVRYYVGPDDRADKDQAQPQAAQQTHALYRHKELQVRPGTSVSYRPPEDLVHVQVQTVTPTWEPTGKEYWLELLTEAPVHIVAGGQKDKIEFKSFEGEIAMIPERERKAGRYEYLSPADRQSREQAQQLTEVGPPRP